MPIFFFLLFLISFVYSFCHTPPTLCQTNTRQTNHQKLDCTIFPRRISLQRLFSSLGLRKQRWKNVFAFYRFILALSKPKARKKWYKFLNIKSKMCQTIKWKYKKSQTLRWVSAMTTKNFYCSVSYSNTKSCMRVLLVQYLSETKATHLCWK